MRGYQASACAVPVDRARRDDRGHQERRGGEVAPDFLEHQRRLGRAQARARRGSRESRAGSARARRTCAHKSVAEPVAAAGVAPVPQLLAGPPSSRRNAAAVSCSIFWSSVRAFTHPFVLSLSNFSTCAARFDFAQHERLVQCPATQDMLGDDVELDLAGPALDRIALGAQPVARRLAVARSLPFERVASRPRPSSVRCGAC